MVFGAAGYVAFHPGVDYLEPRFAHAAETPLQTAAYTIDPNHATIYFEIGHLDLARINGRFNSFSGRIVADAEDIGNSSVDFTAQVESIDTGVEACDNHLRTGDFFDIATYPELTFKSTGVEQEGERYIVFGDLTMHGITKNIAIPFRHYGPVALPGKDGQPGTPKIGVVAEPVVLKRSDFAIGSTTPMPDGRMGLSDEVIVRISFEAVQEQPAGS
jgi:polyisoprenoid-binding protein YceI